MTENNSRRRILQMIGASGVSAQFLSRTGRGDQGNAPDKNFGIEERRVENRLQITNNDAVTREVTVRISRKVQANANPVAFERTYDVPEIGTEDFGNVLTESTVALSTPGTHVVKVELASGATEQVDWHVPASRVPDNRGLAVRIMDGDLSVKPVVA